MLRQLNQENATRYAMRPWEFIDDLDIVDGDGRTVPFSGVMNPYQKRDFKNAIPALMRAVGADDSYQRTWHGSCNWPRKNRQWWERPRGHSKTSDAACLLLWAITFAPRRIKVLAAAADADQSKLVIEAIALLVSLNPQLADVVEVQARRVLNIADKHPAEGSFIEAIASDAGSSYGKLPDVVYCDELSHWSENEAFWSSLLSSAAKRGNCLLLVASNCGWVSTWPFQMREKARQSDAWQFSSLAGPVASWITAETLAGQEAMLRRSEYVRLWRNEWVHTVEEPLLSEALIRQCVDAQCLWPNGCRPDGRLGDIFIGFDVARSKDASVIAVVERDRESGIYWLRECRVMRDVSFADQREEMEWRIHSIGPWLKRVTVDAGGIGHQIHEELASMFPRLVDGVYLGETKQGEMAVEMRSAFERKLIRVPDDPDLESDFLLVQADETGRTGRPKIRTARNATGHGDRFWATALAISGEPIDWQSTRPCMGLPVGVAPIVTSADMQRLDPRNPMAAFVGADGSFNGTVATSLPFYFGG